MILSKRRPTPEEAIMLVTLYHFKKPHGRIFNLTSESLGRPFSRPSRLYFELDLRKASDGPPAARRASTLSPTSEKPQTALRQAVAPLL